MVKIHKNNGKKLNKLNKALAAYAKKRQFVQKKAQLVTGGLVVDTDAKTVSVDGEEVAFTKTEFELLRLLLEHKGRVFSRQELIDHVWPSDVMVLDRTVDVNITRMRKKIGRYAPCISTRLGYGYYFNP